MPKSSTFKQKRRIITVDDIGKEDINFPEFCFGVTGKVPLESQPQELVFVDKINPDAKIVISRGKHGFPTQTTRDLKLALLRLSVLKNGLNSDKLEITAGEVLNEMGLTKSGKNLEILRKHLDILVDTKVKFENSYYDKGENKILSRVVKFNIISGYDIVELKAARKNKKNGEQINFAGYIHWQQQFFENSIQNSKNLVHFDYTLYSSLKGDITKELYLFLNKRKYNKKTLKIDLKVLAFEKLGMSRTLENKLFKVRQTLKRSHETLEKSGFLTDIPVFTKDRSHEYVIYSFHETPRLSLDTSVSESDESLVNMKTKLKNYGFTDGLIGKTLQEHSTEHIQDSLDLLEIEMTKGKIRSPKQWLLACLKKGFDMEPLISQRAEEEEVRERQKQAQEQRELEEQQTRKQEAERAEKHRKIDEWISQNPGKYYTKCKEFYEEIKERPDGKVFYDAVKKKTKDGSDPIAIIMDDLFLSAMVREKIEV